MWFCGFQHNNAIENNCLANKFTKTSNLETKNITYLKYKFWT